MLAKFYLVAALLTGFHTIAEEPQTGSDILAPTNAQHSDVVPINAFLLPAHTLEQDIDGTATLAANLAPTPRMQVFNHSGFRWLAATNYGLLSSRPFG